MKRFSITMFGIILSATAQATALEEIDPVVECELYMSLYDMVSEVTDTTVSNDNVAHRALMTAVLTLSTSLQQDDPDTPVENIMAKVMSAVTDSVAGESVIQCHEY